MPELQHKKMKQQEAGSLRTSDQQLSIKAKQTVCTTQLPLVPTIQT
jgi:hypothetical protein